LPTVLCTFTPAVLIFLGVMPENLVGVVRNFVDEQGFLDFFVISIIAGCILGMPKALLIKAGPRFAVPIVGTLIATFSIVGAVGFLFGFGFGEAVLFVAAPIMAGGLGLGAIPMADMYAAQTGSDPGTFLGNLISAVVIANIFCILIAGFYNGIGRSRKQWFVGFNGFGQLMRIKGDAQEFKTPEQATSARFAALTQGIMITGTLAILGTMIGEYVTALHPYAWTIIIAALIKIFGLLPHELEQATSKWGDVMSTAFVPALLVGVSITFIDVEEVLASLANPAFIPLTLLTVLVATITSGILGWLMKFYFVEAAITPGLVMADTGGSGDVSVLSAANRMHLMPFAALTNRVGGALVLFVTSLLVPLLAAT
jgi:malate:Na+ symporter